MRNALLILGAYLWGALPVVYLIARMRGVDLSKEEDMHSGLWHKVGHREGLIGIVWDVVKGAIAVVVVVWVFDLGWGVNSSGYAVRAGVGLAVVVGEMWSVFLKFRGEKANTTGLGMSVALAYKAAPFILVPVAIGVFIRTFPRLFGSKESWNERLKFGGPPSLSMPLGMIIGFALLPLGCWIMHLPWEVIIACVILFVLIAIKRIVTGLKKDFETTNNKKSILLNRFLFDRSYL